MNRIGVCDCIRWTEEPSSQAQKQPSSAPYPAPPRLPRHPAAIPPSASIDIPIPFLHASKTRLFFQSRPYRFREQVVPRAVEGSGRERPRRVRGPSPERHAWYRPRADALMRADAARRRRQREDRPAPAAGLEHPAVTSMDVVVDQIVLCVAHSDLVQCSPIKTEMSESPAGRGGRGDVVRFSRNRAKKTKG